MDETTHIFSPKVLDRAFTMELSDVDFTDYPPIATSVDAAMTEAARDALLVDFSRGGEFIRIDKAEIGLVLSEYPQIRGWLQTLNQLLARSRMNFGYRTFDEVAAFVGNGMHNFSDPTIEAVFDRAVLMKVLPKFSGSASRLERPLLDFLAWCVHPVRIPQAEIRDAAEKLGDGGWLESNHEVFSDDMVLPVTGKRVQRMLDTLAVEGFASFG
ncbi:MAG TPA: hypothetical protein VFQ54_12020 [Thermomicrobiales bacterium]|nr:hypothetical protein [Thermomicrobiales bacterium]